MLLFTGADLHGDRDQCDSEGDTEMSGRHQQDQGNEEWHDGKCTYQHYERGNVGIQLILSYQMGNIISGRMMGIHNFYKCDL